jgi:NitT/TauT family transport system substrate-binding protein
MPARWIAWASATAVALVTCGPAAAQDRAVFASPGAGSAVGLLSEIIKKDRLDARHGLELDIKYFDPAAAEQAVLLRRADVGIFATIAAARANLSGHRVRLFAPALVNHSSVLVPSGTAASSLADLKGKRLGTLDRISMTYTTLATIARLQGLDLERDFKLTLSPPPVLMGLFARRELDVVVIFEPLVTRLLAEGNREVMRVNDVWRKDTGQSMVALGIGAHDDWLRAHPETARRIFRTLKDAVSTVQRQPRAVVETFRDFLGARTDDQIARLAERLPQLYPTTWDRPLFDSMMLLLRKNVELGLLQDLPKDALFVSVE